MHPFLIGWNLSHIHGTGHIFTGLVYESHHLDGRTDGIFRRSSEQECKRASEMQARNSQASNLRHHTSQQHSPPAAALPDWPSWHCPLSSSTTIYPTSSRSPTTFYRNSTSINNTINIIAINTLLIDHVQRRNIFGSVHREHRHNAKWDQKEFGTYAKFGSKLWVSK